MLEQPVFAITDERRVRELVRDNPWATLVTAGPDGPPLVSHLPVLVEDGEPLSIVGHLARADDLATGLADRDALLIVTGPQGYLSPSWYGEPQHVPTWNFVVVHLSGRPVLLDADQTYRVLSDTVDHLESRLPEPWSLDRVSAYAERIAAGTVGFRLVPDRVVAKAKLSQDESPALVSHAVAALEEWHAYRNPQLAKVMAQALADRS